MPAFRIGLTGGIGSGKSTVASILLQLGAGVIDADGLSHELTAPGGAAVPAISTEFGEAVLGDDGSLDRSRMRTQAFADPTTRHRLEAILHPMIRALGESRERELVSAGAPYVVFVIPLLIESGNWRGRFDRILLVDCSQSVQIARVCARPGIDPETAARIISVQASRASRLAAADDVIFNELPIETVEPRVRQLHSAYLALAGRPRINESV